MLSDCCKFPEIRRLSSTFIALRWYGLEHIFVQVTSLRISGAVVSISNFEKRSSTRKNTQTQFWNHQAKYYVWTAEDPKQNRESKQTQDYNKQIKTQYAMSKK